MGELRLPDFYSPARRAFCPVIHTLFEPDLTDHKTCVPLLFIWALLIPLISCNWVAPLSASHPEPHHNCWLIRLTFNLALVPLSDQANQHLPHHNPWFIHPISVQLVPFSSDSLDSIFMIVLLSLGYHHQPPCPAMPPNLIDISVDPRDLLPQVIVDEWLPGEEESVLFLFQQFKRYPPHPSNYILPSNLKLALHQDAVQGFDYESLLKIPPPALPSIPTAYQDAIKASTHPIHSVTLRPCHGSPITLPAWVFDYWKEIGRAVDTRKRWKISLAWVREQSTSPLAEEVCHRLLLGLSSFSWSHGAAYTCDITPLLSDSPVHSYLSGYHINKMIAQMRDQYREYHGPHIAGRHIFATVDHFNAIFGFYGNMHQKKEGYLWDGLMMVENKIIMGEVDSLGGVMHLPEHWVSVVIEFQQQRILYGDSLGQQIPARERRTFERWIKHLVNRSTKLPIYNKATIDWLPTQSQNDSTSCGLFALNAIAHHYLEHPLLSSDPIALACRRMEIVLHIIGSMTVCLFQIVWNSIAQ